MTARRSSMHTGTGTMTARTDRRCMTLRMIAALLWTTCILAGVNAAVFVVQQAQDGSVGSLRWAISQANAADDEDIIRFAFGVPTDLPIMGTSLPTILHPVLIDGGGRLGFNPAWQGTGGGQWPVSINGSNIVPSIVRSVGFTISAVNVTIRGLALYGFSDGLVVTSNASNILFDSCVIFQIVDSGFNLFSNAFNITLRNNTIFACMQYGVLSYSNNVLLEVR